ncbi:hypothetical protein WKK05_11045 [Nostoc sp. UHCC 0302]|uniref:hypothetical protein n=1 Tax=Nostoc sp. UHCC 0302 TaxID=3134896 RepID=UPI00311CD90A
MKPLKIVLVVLLFLINLGFAQPSWADRISEDSPEYPQVVQTLNSLLTATNNPEQAGYTAEELQQKIAALQLQKQTMENSEDWAICRNETGKKLAIYARKPENSTQNSLYYLGQGESTDEDWDCDAIYLPNGSKIAGLNQPIEEPAVLKIVDGTHLVARTNPTTQEMEFNVPPALFEVLKAGQVNWQIPNLAQADIDIQTPNAPTD